MRNCPHCGGHLPAATRTPKAPAPAAIINVEEMSDAELFAYRKRTASAEDLKFFLRLSMSDALRLRAEALAAETKQQKGDLSALRATWRAERQTADRAADIPAIGSERWFEAAGIRAMAEEAA